MLRKLIRGVDARRRRGIGIVEFEQGEDALVRIGTGRAERAMELSDGTRLQPGDLLLELHFWNEHLMTLPSAGPTLRWAVSTRRQVTRSLHRLAAYLQRTPDLREVKALRIRPAFAGRNLARNLTWIVAKHGFESAEDQRNPVPPLARQPLTLAADLDLQSTQPQRPSLPADAPGILDVSREIYCDLRRAE